MTMDIEHLRGFLYSVVDFCPHCLFAPCLVLWTIFVECDSKRRKKASSLKKKANTEESEFVDG